jgi:S1-C subfamily serine protease
MAVVCALAIPTGLAGCSLGSRVAHDASSSAGATSSSSGQVYGGKLAGGSITDAEWAAAVAGAKANTALVHITGCDFTATGSAAAIGPSRMVTNKHVVDGARELSVVTAAGKKADVTSWAYSQTDDLAILELAQPIFSHPLSVASEPVVPGDLVVVMGFPLGGPFTTGRGRISGLTDDFDEPMLKATVDILPGNSGGPLVSTKGQIAGLIRAIDLHADLALAISPQRVQDAIDGVGTTRGVPCQ